MSRTKYGAISSASPSPIPPHVRPSNTRHSSSSSTSSRRPHPQQREYIPSTIETGFTAEPAESGLNERWAYERAEHLPAYERRKDHGRDVGGEDDEGEDEGDEGSEADWAAARERDLEKVPKWRRPSPRWLCPFVSGATLALGMGVAPRSELYINLACLAHPPQAPNSLQAISSMAEWGGNTVTPISMNILGVSTYHFESPTVSFPAPNNSSLPPNNPSGEHDDISPADQWFYRLQKEIYEYKRSHRLTSPSEGTSTIVQPRPTPTGPVPHVPEPTPSAPSPPDTGRHGEEGGSGTGAEPPYRQIDPKICKKDPKVQAAAARLTMSKFLVSRASDEGIADGYFSYDFDSGHFVCFDNGLLGPDVGSTWTDKDHGADGDRTHV